MKLAAFNNTSDRQDEIWKISLSNCSITGLIMVQLLCFSLIRHKNIEAPLLEKEKQDSEVY